MKTPIYDFVKGYADSDSVRMHMPGHKGRGELGCERLDITEISGADVLYSADGIIEESENNLSALYGTAHSYYSTEGSTLAISAMLAIVSRYTRGERALVFAARNVHTSFVKAAALLDIDVEWLYPEEGGHLCSANITAEGLREALSRAKRPPRAVYVTSPDYLGRILDIAALSRVSREFGVPLLVDNAHGAYLKFLENDCHPITLGAAMCADSAHKTLPALTGGAYLHVSRDYPELCDGARWALSLFASTSPSYLTLCSLDLCNKYLSEELPKRLSNICTALAHLRGELSSLGYVIEDSEPLKVVINALGSGVSSEDIANALRELSVEPEFVDREYVVLMPSAKTDETELSTVLAALASAIKRRTTPALPRAYPIRAHTKALSIREAVLSPSEYCDVDDSLVGRISAAPTVSCPPAVPIVISGERIEKSDISVFKYYGINKVLVVTETAKESDGL